MYALSQQNDEATARTCMAVAEKRAENLSSFGIKSVIELCVGPSLRILEEQYAGSGIEVTGNDIDPRWKKYYPQGNWVVGDALEVPISHFDAAVFGPPLSKGCSGKREDSLQIERVTPSYRNYLVREGLPELSVLVLPGRSLATKEDRSQFHKLISFLYSLGAEFKVEEMKDIRGRITKYIDLYIWIGNE